MPELPEVETVRRGLIPVMEGVQIASVDVRRSDLRWPFPENMAARLKGTMVTRLARRSKYLLLELDSGETALIHLGMSGRMQIAGAPTPGVFHSTLEPLEKHDHVVFYMQNGARIAFNDARRFGAMDMFSTHQSDTHWLLKKLGPEPTSNRFNEGYLMEVFARKKTVVKTALLDQSIVAGLGNIYVCETLFRASVHPERKVNTLTRQECSDLVHHAREVLDAAIEAGGSSLRDHRQADGSLGYFQHGFAVYGRQAEACQSCDAPIERIVQSSRSTFFCARCQR